MKSIVARKNTFIEKANEKFNNKFNYSKVNYVNNHTKVTIICPEHGEFEQNPSTHLSLVYGCSKCYRDYNNILDKYDSNVFNTRGNKKFNNKFDYSKVNYVNNHTKVTIICPEHGEFEQLAQDHLNSVHGCPKCASKNLSNLTRINKDEFIQKGIAKFENKFDYSKVNYVDYVTKIKIICPEHGDFEQTPVEHLKATHGCIKCATINTAKSRTLDIDEFIEKANIIHNNKYDYSKSEYINYDNKIKIICPKHGEFDQEVGNHLQGHGCPKCKKSDINFEITFSKILNSENIQHKCNDRIFINPKEIDILIPDFKIGIEYNGILYHSYGTTYPNNFSILDKMYHLNKTELVENKKYQLFHIFENEWLNPTKNNIWLSLLRNKLNLIPKDNIIGARKCHIRQISNDISKEFQEHNHLQGYRTAKINLGLYYNDKLMSLMTFGKPVFSKKYEYELIRFCSKVNHRIIGGASKLLKYFERNYKPKSIITYANRRWSVGNLYEKLGFTFLHNSNPNYFYIKNGKLYSRNYFQKHMLKDKLKLFDEDLSELQNMINNKYRVIYDCGNKVYSKLYLKDDSNSI